MMAGQHERPSGFRPSIDMIDPDNILEYAFLVRMRLQKQKLRRQQKQEQQQLLQQQSRHQYTHSRQLMPLRRRSLDDLSMLRSSTPDATAAMASRSSPAIPTADTSAGHLTSYINRPQSSLNQRYLNATAVMPSLKNKVGRFATVGVSSARERDCYYQQQSLQDNLLLTTSPRGTPRSTPPSSPSSRRCSLPAILEHTTGTEDIADIDEYGTPSDDETHYGFGFGFGFGELASKLDEIASQRKDKDSDQPKTYVNTYKQVITIQPTSQDHQPHHPLDHSHHGSILPPVHNARSTSAGRLKRPSITTTTFVSPLSPCMEAPEEFSFPIS
eukprot:m.190229 g.190229  ORF g.190229 m.190229 type:complete len:328 (+) comp16753_c4_seq2:195-1178(+)